METIFQASIDALDERIERAEMVLQVAWELLMDLQDEYDDPFNGLDDEAMAALNDRIVRLIANGVTIEEQIERDRTARDAFQSVLDAIQTSIEDILQQLIDAGPVEATRP